MLFVLDFWWCWTIYNKLLYKIESIEILSHPGKSQSNNFFRKFIYPDCYLRLNHFYPVAQINSFQFFFWIIRNSVVCILGGFTAFIIGLFTLVHLWFFKVIVQCAQYFRELSKATVRYLIYMIFKIFAPNSMQINLHL